jgi:inosine-uridine nucleoside N-ribohydrolase
MAAVAAVKPEVMGYHPLPILVDLQEGPTLGQTRPDPAGVKVKIAEEFNRETFETEFLTKVLD